LTDIKLPDEGRILEALRGSSRGPMKPKALASALHVPNGDYRAFRDRLRVLEEGGIVYRVKGGRYAAPDRISLVRGVLSTIRSGDAFVRVDDASHADVFVPMADHATAMDGDRVVARIERRPRGRNPVGRVIKVLERAHPTVVGTYHDDRKIGYVVPRDPSLASDIIVPPGDQAEAREGDVVVVRIVSFGEKGHGPTGEVERVLGPLEDPGVDVLSVLFGHGLPLEFPDGVERAAAQVVDTLDIETQSDREDLRDRLVFTIDPADAKDHDDALSIRDLGNGLVEVGIHIADVSAYVRPGETVDLEALERGTSVYLVDRVVPMLPHALSSGACSLKPGEARLAVTLLATLDAEGRVREHRFARTIVRSRHKLAYEDVQTVLDGDSGVDAETDRAIKELDRLAQMLRGRREQRGSIDFDLPEARVVLDNEGAPVDIVRVQRLTSHRLVEDFMLLANELVAREAEARRLPILYRIHEPPTLEKTQVLREFLASLGQTLPKRKLRPGDLQAVLERVQGRPEEALISTVVLRSMQRAIYSPENLGHFGLATDHYAHFTSPIRRYPDLVTHRVVIRALIEGGPVPDTWAEALAETAERCSLREQAAARAERDSVALKKIEFMERHLGDDFEGTVAGVTSFGFFVLLDAYFVEGLVHVNSMDDDYYEFRENEYALVGSRRGRRFRLGDRVRIRVARVDREERHVDFMLLESFPPDAGK
jgi:ribonuclease R